MYEVEPQKHDGSFVNTQIIKELLDGLSNQGIARTYNTFVNKDIRYHSEIENCLYVFYGLLHALAFVYIVDQVGISKKSPEYADLISKLSQLSGHTNGWYNLDVDEYEKAITLGLVPLNVDAMNAPLENLDQPLKFINMTLLLEAVSIVYRFIENEVYEPVTVKTTGDRHKDTLLKFEQYCHRSYVQLAAFEQYMREHSTSQISRKAPGKNSLNIDL